MELAALKTAENRIECSGWPGELVQVGVATCGKADAFMKASHIPPTSAGLRTGQTGQLPRGLHKKGPPQMHFFFNMAVSYRVCHRGLLVNVC